MELNSVGNELVIVPGLVASTLSSNKFKIEDFLNLAKIKDLFALADLAFAMTLNRELGEYVFCPNKAIKYVVPEDFARGIRSKLSKRLEDYWFENSKPQYDQVCSISQLQKTEDISEECSLFGSNPSYAPYELRYGPSGTMFCILYSEYFSDNRDRMGENSMSLICDILKLLYEYNNKDYSSVSKHPLFGAYLYSFKNT